MIDYDIGDKVVCISTETDWLGVVKSGLRDFDMPMIGHIYTVRDIRSGEHFNSDIPGVRFHELRSGIFPSGREAWLLADRFRKAG